jgi:hypothetical protein
MAQENGRELVIKRSTAGDGSGTRVFVCGLRTSSWSISNAEIDTTVPNCTNPALPIVATSAPGRQTLEFTGEGLADTAGNFRAVADDARLQRKTQVYEVIVPGYGRWTGPMAVFDWVATGTMEEPLGFSATWRPVDATALIFTAIA